MSPSVVGSSIYNLVPRASALIARPFLIQVPLLVPKIYCGRTMVNVDILNIKLCKIVAASFRMAFILFAIRIIAKYLYGKQFKLKQIFSINIISSNFCKVKSRSYMSFLTLNINISYISS